MKIGILTHPLDYNYGCLLQAFALQKTLKDMGHDVITINRHSDPNRSVIVSLKSWVLRLARKIQGHTVSLAWNPSLSPAEKNILSSNTKLFVDRCIIHTEIVYPKDLVGIDLKYAFEAYIVGSDQVWLPHFSSNCFLDFVKRDNVKRVFYAASSGSSSFADDPELVSKCKVLSEKLSGISVREDFLIPVAKRALGKDAIQVLDPTLLLDADDYLFACIENVSSSPIIFTYILDKTEAKRQLIEKVYNELGLPVVSGTVEKDYKKNAKMDILKCVYPSIDHWILNLSRAKFVVTDSFHGTCMSIVFRKPFVVVGNKARGINRFLSVLKLFGLENRLITKASEFKPDLYADLDESTISTTLNTMRTKSINFIINSLK